MTYTILSGGVGGAKLVTGFADLLPADQLRVIANTGDDFEHLGLHISPDIDTLTYSLAGIANPETGWGLVDETFSCMSALENIGGETWFKLGDKDLATHLHRKTLLDSGKSLSQVTRNLCEKLNVTVPVIPMSNDTVSTMVHSDQGVLSFQEYFVKLQAAPKVEKLIFAGSESAKLPEAARLALSQDSLQAIVLTPSNPYLSIDPILAVPGLKECISASSAPVIAVSPIVGGKALKGPTAKIMQELGLETSVISIAEHYSGIIDGLVIDTVDKAHQDAIENMGIRVLAMNTVMNTAESKKNLAAGITDFAKELTH